MEWFAGVSELNWWAVLVATASSFAVGSVWYSMKVFGRRWARLNGIDPDNLGDTDGLAGKLVGAGLMAFVTVVVLGAIMVGLNISGWWQGLVFGVVVGLVLRGGAHVIHNGFAGRSGTLTVIDAGHDAVAVGLAGLVLGLWP